MRQVLFLVAALNILQGQQSEPVKVPEPDVFGVMFYLDPSSHTITALPKEQAKSGGKAKAGFGSVSAVGSTQLSGISSSFRVPASDKSEFVFKVGGNVDPTSVKLYPCTQDKKKKFRQMDTVTIKNTGTFHATSTQTPISGVDVDIVKHGESSYKLVAKRLAPGEYAILMRADAVFTFSIQ